MTRTQTRIAIKEITKSSKISAAERLELGDLIWKANALHWNEDYYGARAVIDFLKKAGKISLTEAFDLADLLG